MDGVWKRVGEAEVAGGASALATESAGSPLAPVPALAARKVKCEAAERPLASAAESGGCPLAASPAPDTHPIPSVAPQVLRRIEGVDLQEWALLGSDGLAVGEYQSLLRSGDRGGGQGEGGHHDQSILDCAGLRAPRGHWFVGR